MKQLKVTVSHAGSGQLLSFPLDANRELIKLKIDLKQRHTTILNKADKDRKGVEIPIEFQILNEDGAVLWSVTSTSLATSFRNLEDAVRRMKGPAS